MRVGALGAVNHRFAEGRILLTVNKGCAGWKIVCHRRRFLQWIIIEISKHLYHSGHSHFWADPCDGALPGRIRPQHFRSVWYDTILNQFAITLSPPFTAHSLL